MKKAKDLLTVSLYIIVAALACSIWFIYYFNNKLGPGLIECAENEIERLTIIVMNNCINKYLKENDYINILKITRNSNDEIELIEYDTKAVNQITNNIADMLEQDLNYMVRGEFDKLNLSNVSSAYYDEVNKGILFSISIGSATGNTLLANIGPKIPLNLSVAENVQASVNTKVTEYGMNNAMVEVFVNLTATTVIHMPLLSKKIKVENNIPLNMQIINGNLPSYYLNNN